MMVSKPTLEEAVQKARFTLDADKKIILRDGVPVQLTRTEYAIASTLLQFAGTVMTPKEVLAYLGPNYSNHSNHEAAELLKVYILHIRRKLEDDPSNPNYIRTARSVGYLFEDGQAEAPKNVLRIGDFVVNYDHQEIQKAGKPLPLTHSEYNIARLLMEHEGEILSHYEIAASGGIPHEFLSALDFRNMTKQYIHKIRQKIGDEPRMPEFIHTVRGFGYAFSDVRH